MATCVFCGFDGKLSNEHVFPEWLRPYLQGAGEKGTHTRTELREGQEPMERSHRDAPATWTVKAVCAGCNNGWMSALEEQAKPILLPLIRGKMRMLNVPAQELIATWSVKTALVAGSRFVPQIPVDFYRELYEARRLVNPTRVWLGHTPHLGAHSMDWRPMKLHPDEEEPPSEHNGYQAVLSVGHLAVFLLRWRERKPPLAKVFPRFEAALVRVWPAESRVLWPPRARITLLTGLDALADALGAVPAVAETAERPD